MTLQIHLFGNLEIVSTDPQHHHTQLDNQSIVIKTNKEKALLIFLLLEPGLQPRTRLISKLWPDRPPANALKNLRQTLYQLDRSLGEHRHLVQRNRSAIWIDHKNRDVDVDVWTVDRLLEECRNHRHDTVESCDQCLAKFRQLVELNRSNLFGEWPLETEIPFTDWLLHQRAQWKDDFVWVFSILAQAAMEAGDWRDALTFAKKIILLDRYDEQGVMLFMRAASANNNRASALMMYDQYVDSLDEAFAASPSDSLQQLYVQIKLGRIAPDPI